MEEGVSYWASPPFEFVVVYYLLLWGVAWRFESAMAQKHKNFKRGLEE
jgi:hypothetical protein